MKSGPEPPPRLSPGAGGSKTSPSPGDSRLSDTPGSLLGYGATLGLAVELADYGFYPVAHKDDDASYVGLVGGQWGMGLYAGANLRDIGQGRYYAVTIGVSGRIPFSIGVLCCIDPTERKRRKRR